MQRGTARPDRDRTSGPSQRHSASLRAARLGQTAWLFGNLYEALVGIPQLLVAAKDCPSGFLTAGSPVRYYLPFAPPAVIGTTVTLFTAWRSGSDRRVIAASAANSATALALSGYLIRTVNQPLLSGSRTLTETEQRRLISTWHRFNALRLLALAIARNTLSRL